MNPKTRIRLLLAAGALASALVLPGAAGAATITWKGDTLYYTAAPGEANQTGPWYGVVDESKITISDGYGITVTDSTGGHCAPVADRFECDVPEKMIFALGDGDDFMTWSDQRDIEYVVDGGPGDDDLRGFSGSMAVGLRQTIDGGPGNDKIDGDKGDDVVRGGPGNDEVDGGGGDDRVEGGDGDDTMLGDGYEDAGTDVIDGGAGRDSIDEWVQPGEDVNPRVAISFDSVANDGRPGENDNVVNIEKLGASVSGTFTGGPGADDYFVRAAFNDSAPSTVIGGGGPDKLVGHDYVETIDGGPGDDVIEGGLNDDTITGGPGKDRILGDSSANTCNFLACRYPFGNDTINARDGEKDSIDCGVGEDKAIVDAIDVVSGCETVDAGKGPGPKPGGTDGTLTGPSKFTRKALRKGVAASHECASACTIKLTLTADRKTAKKLGTKLVATGKASGSGTVTVTAKLTKKARKRLGRVRSGKATMALVATEGGATQRFAKVVKLQK
jgi:Ca2+-binding RTX toxin-like protein